MEEETGTMKTDIIIPIWNQPEFTRECIESVFRNTQYPFHLILVDNASDATVKNYLEQLAQERKDAVTLIRNEENLGFVKAVNQGIKKSSSPYVCLLNNDTQVAEGWLKEMVKVAEARKENGIVNPNSNTLGCKVKKGQSMESLARELKSYTGKWSDLALANGFCMLIKNEVLRKVGLFDEIYGMGNFEDADFSKRAQQLGYYSVCAKAAYVYHRERRSFRKHKTFDRNFERNRQIFFKKWGRIKRILYVITQDNPAYTERIGGDALELARQGHVVWIILKGKGRRNIQKHSNIYIFNLPENFFGLICFWRILKRKKKFDTVYVDNETYQRGLKKLKSFHKAEVIYEQ